MNLPQQQALGGAIPDLREIPLDRLAQLEDTVLANAFALYRQRSRDGVLFNAFNNAMPSTISPRLGHVSLDQHPPAPR